jgi:SAM-dependent methyltransferase
VSGTHIPDYSATYDPDTDFDVRYTIATGRRIARWIRPGDRVLELGCATGAMTEHLAAPGARLTCVDRSDAYLDRLRARGLELARVVEGDVERLDLGDGPWDHAVATNLLHELADPLAFLRRTGAALAPGGLLHVTLQNPHSLHRLLAFEMGLIDDVEELSDRGRAYGSTRLWRAEDLMKLAGEAGLEVAHREGVFLKPFANDQMATLSDEILDALEKVALRLPEVSAMTYLVLRRA